MEVKLNIESNQIGETVIDLFKNLSPEKKEELATEVVKSYLNDKVNQKLNNNYWNSETVLSDFMKRIDNYFIEDLKNNEFFIKSKEECIKLLIEKLPEIVLQAMTISIASQLSNTSYQLTDIVMKNMNIECKLNEVRNRMGMNY